MTQRVCEEQEPKLRKQDVSDVRSGSASPARVRLSHLQEIQKPRSKQRPREDCGGLGGAGGAVSRLF